MKKSAFSGRFFCFVNQGVTPWLTSSYTKSVVIALVKLENLKANHNAIQADFNIDDVVIALVKLENLKANHNYGTFSDNAQQVVIALVKLENLKANHNI